MLRSPRPITSTQSHPARPMADIALLPHGLSFHLRIRFGLLKLPTDFFPLFDPKFLFFFLGASTMSSTLQLSGTAEMISSPLLNRRVAFWLLLICGIGTIFVCDTRHISLRGSRRKEVKSFPD